MKLFAFHLLNDYSGSPKVLQQLIKIWKKKGLNVTIVTSKNRLGFLSDIEGVNYIYFRYQLASNPILRLLNLFFSQFVLILRLLFVIKKDDLIYVNTVLPFGAALLGKLKGCRVIYHVHETSMKPKIFKSFLFGMLRFTADEVIFVSDYLRQDLQITNIKTTVLYNAIEDEFIETAKQQAGNNQKRQNILMLCSLKPYKGVYEFLDLAYQLPMCQFKLVLNANQNDIDRFFNHVRIPFNLQLFPAQTNTHPFYQWADLVLNLSKPDAWIETFGLTIIEGMAYGLPAIVPSVGGITELIDEGQNGYKIDSWRTIHLSEVIQNLFSDEELYKSMRIHAFNKIQHYSEANFSRSSMAILTKQDYASQTKFANI